MTYLKYVLEYFTHYEQSAIWSYMDAVDKYGLSREGFDFSTLRKAYDTLLNLVTTMKAAYQAFIGRTQPLPSRPSLPSSATATSHSTARKKDCLERDNHRNLITLDATLHKMFDNFRLLIKPAHFHALALSPDIILPSSTFKPIQHGTVIMVYLHEYLAINMPDPTLLLIRYIFASVASFFRAAGEPQDPAFGDWNRYDGVGSENDALHGDTSYLLSCLAEVGREQREQEQRGQEQEQHEGEQHGQEQHEFNKGPTLVA
ncbi:hypothetical protein RUND412_008081 [Rhizina undulata]